MKQVNRILRLFTALLYSNRNFLFKCPAGPRSLDFLPYLHKQTLWNWKKGLSVLLEAFHANPVGRYVPLCRRLSVGFTPISKVLWDVTYLYVNDPEEIRAISIEHYVPLWDFRLKLDPWELGFFLQNLITKL